MAGDFICALPRKQDAPGKYSINRAVLPAYEKGSIRQASPVAQQRVATIGKFLDLNLDIEPDFLMLACYNITYVITNWLAPPIVVVTGISREFIIKKRKQFRSVGLTI